MKTRTKKNRSLSAQKVARTRLATQPKSTRVRAGHQAVAGLPKGTLTREALSKQTKMAARRRSAKERSQAAYHAVETKGPRGLSEAARKAAETRASY